MRTNTISFWMLPQFPESVNVLVLAVIEEILFVCSFKVLLEVRYLNDWLFQELVRLSFFHLSSSHLLSSTQLLGSWLRSFLSCCNLRNAGLWFLLSLFLCWLLVIKNVLLILFIDISLKMRDFCSLRLNLHHIHH